MSRSTHTKVKKLYTDLKKLCCIESISVSADTQNFWYRFWKSGIEPTLAFIAHLSQTSSSFARCACVICARVCVCMQSVVKRSKCGLTLQNWATPVSDVICSSIIVNKRGNTSNVMKHLLTKLTIYLKQCAVFTSALVLPQQRLMHLNCIPKRLIAPQ